MSAELPGAPEHRIVPGKVFRTELLTSPPISSVSSTMR
jgi:hypothetical protein